MIRTAGRLAVLLALLSAVVVTSTASASPAATQDELEEAERLLRDVVEQREATLGANHPQTLEAKRKLAEVLAARAQHDESIPLLRSILEVQQQTLGANHPETIRTKEALAVALLESYEAGGEERQRPPEEPEVAGERPKLAPSLDRNLPHLFQGRRGRKGGSSQTEKAVDLGLDWLARHQSPDGKWDADGFTDLCSGGPCGGHANALNDNGLTGLALLAFLGAGSTTTTGDYRPVVRKGIQFLTRVQDDDEGIFGQRVGQHYMYNHALAALAMTEAYVLSGFSPLLKEPAQKGVDFILRSRNPYKAWRYESPPNGENDTSVTGWMVTVLATARTAGLDVDLAAFDGALAWIDEMTNSQTGRTGYLTKGGLSARETGTEVKFPNDKTEAMTAVALQSRLFIGQDPDDPMFRTGAALLRRMPPRWEPEAGWADMYYWFHGANVMYQLGGRDWYPWNEALKDAILPHQHQEEACLRGSWDPIGPWGEAGGRIYSTALMVLTLEVYYRYRRW